MSFDTDIIRRYGGDPSSLFRFDNEADDQGWNLLPYATLTAARKSRELAALIGVYEWQNRPLFLLADGEALDNDPDGLAVIRRIAALRGDAPYLAVHRDGRLIFHDVGLDDKVQNSKIDIDDANNGMRMVIPNLVNKRPIADADKRLWISDVILKLLTKALDSLTGAGIELGDAISFAGRALFTRFLADRGLLGEDVAALGNGRGIAGLFETPASTIAISEWLDKTFNGDFLPLSDVKVAAFPKAAFDTGGHILRRAEGGQLPLDWAEDWAKLDFAHIPVGVLSQVYEQYLGKKHQKKQKKEGSYYTPAHIAELMVHASFASLRRDGVAHTAKVLDPAAGAGVFLITSFRQLVRERWMHDGVRPNTKTIRDILYQQVRGFDINDSALRFAALGLYLMAIELDDEPVPVEKLVFPGDLRKAVIFKLGMDDDPEGSKDLGSLGDDVGSEHTGQYDLVIGNPPWSKAHRLPGWPSVLDRVSHIAHARGVPAQNPVHLLPKKALDLPFVWRAMQWGKPNAQIAFALHGRLLFHRGDGQEVALQSLLRALDVTSIVNGAEVRTSDVWPNVVAPFCLLFARNVPSPPGSSFRYVSPHLEGPLNEKGGWRIDTASAGRVSVSDVCENPAILKILFRGTSLDREILERISDSRFPSFGEHWATLFGKTEGGLNNSSNGYKVGSKKIPLGELAEFPALEKQNIDGILLKSSNFRRFGDLAQDLEFSGLERPRDVRIYENSKLIVHESPSASLGRIRCYASFERLIFNQSYYGYAPYTHDHPNELIKYLSLLVGSKICLWHGLMTSGKFGVERETVEKFVIEEMPVKPFKELSRADFIKLNELFDLLVSEETDEQWRRVDDWVYSLFGLSVDDIQVISDTLMWNSPFTQNSNSAQTSISQPQREAFAKELKRNLDPWAERFERPLEVACIEAPPLSPWNFVLISRAGAQKESRMHLKLLDEPHFDLADSLSASEIFYYHALSGSLIIGRLNQARYWSKSQARLAARRIIWEHIDFLSGKAAA